MAEFYRALCTVPHVASWSSDGGWLATLSRDGALDVHDLASGKLVGQTPPDPCMTLRAVHRSRPVDPPSVCGRNVLTIAAPFTPIFGVHEEGLQRIVACKRHEKQFFSFPKRVGLLVRGKGALHYASALAAAAAGPYEVTTHDPTSGAVRPLRFAIDGELRALGHVDGALAWVALREGALVLERRMETTERLAVLDAPGEPRLVYLGDDGALAVVAVRTANKKSEVVAYALGTDGRRLASASLGSAAETKKRGNRVDVRSTRSGALFAVVFGAPRAPALRVRQEGPNEVRDELGPLTFCDLSPDAARMVVVEAGVGRVVNWATPTEGFPLDPGGALAREAEKQRADAAARTLASETAPTNDPRVLLARKLRAMARRSEAAAVAGRTEARLKTLDERAFAEQAPLVELAIAHPRTSDEALEFLDARARAPEPRIPTTVQAAIVARVAARALRLFEANALVDRLVRASDADYAAEVAKLAQPVAVDLAGAHSILAHAIRAAAPGWSPPGPCHRGEPMPSLQAVGWPRVAEFMARRVAYTLRSGERAAFDRALDAARPGAERSSERPSPPDKATSIALQLAASAAVEARTAWSRPDAVGSSLRPTTARAVRYLVEHEGPDAVAEFVQALDDELRRLDLIYAVVQRFPAEGTLAVTRAILRSKDPPLWLGELADGTCVLLWKQKGRFSLLKEGRDVVLATIPDALFEEAALRCREGIG